jgi:hypothetical protein
MKQTVFHNDTDKPQYVGGVMIPARSARMVDARLVPGATPAAEVPAPTEDAILGLLDGTVKDIHAALPGLSDEDLLRLENAENDGKTRKGVLEAVAEERLNRAQRNGAPQ